MSQTIASLSSPVQQRIPIEAPRKNPQTGVFETLIDTINPLQQIPGVGQAYRAVTHDHLSNGAQLAGHLAIGAAIAGPIGAAAGAGVFLLEHLIPGVFKFVGRLFSTGKTSDQPADAPQVRLSQSAPQKSLPKLSSSQFESLFSNFGGPVQPVGANTGQPQDLPAVIAANLEKYRKLQHITAPVTQGANY